MTNSILSLNAASLSLEGNAGTVDILHDISLEVTQGETLGLVGPSGSGKSSLLMLMAGLEQLSSGEIVAFGQDYLRGLDPAVSRANLAEILAYARDADVKVLLVGLQAAPNYGVEYKLNFDGMYAELAAEYGVALYASWFEGILSQGDPQEVRAAYFQADGLHPNAAGVALIVEAMGPAVRELALSVE